MEFTRLEVARSTRSWLAGSLCTLLVFLPLLSTAAQAQNSSPDLGAADAVFESYDGGLAVEADNGFDVSVVNGEWRHDGHTHLGGSGRIASPWGEEMSLRFWHNPDGSFAVEYDGNALLHYTFDEFGGLENVTAVTETGLSTTFAGRRAEGAALGAVDPLALDFAPYELFLGQVARNHGRAFLDGADRLARKLQTSGGPAPASCFTDILSCTASIIFWIASVPGIAAGCTTGAAVTLGGACLAAILVHEGASVAAVAECTNAIQNCIDRDHQHGDPGDGCNGPGGGAE